MRSTDRAPEDAGLRHPRLHLELALCDPDPRGGKHSQTALASDRKQPPSSHGSRGILRDSAQYRSSLTLGAIAEGQGCGAGVERLARFVQHIPAPFFWKENLYSKCSPEGFPGKTTSEAGAVRSVWVLL